MVQIGAMKKINTSWLTSLLGSGSRQLAADSPAEVQPARGSGNSLGLDRNGNEVENPLLPMRWHCLVLGATGTGKTTLLRELVRNISCRLIWAESESADLAALQRLISNHERFEFPALLLVDDVHLFAEHLELIELVARDGLKANVFLVVTAQQLSDLPQAVWRNCQVKFALGQDASEELNLGIENPKCFEAVFSWPERTGALQVLQTRQVVETNYTPAGNPLMRSASTPQSALCEESAQAHQTPLDQWSEEVLAAPQGLHDRQLGSTNQPHRTRYSRTL
jgi:hypothetical protein